MHTEAHLGNGEYKNNTKSNQFEYSARSILVKIFDVQGMTKKAAVILPNQFADQAPSAGLLVGFYKLVDDKHPRLAVSLDPGPDTAHCELLHSFSRRKSLRDRPLSRRTSPATRSSPAPQCVSPHDQFWSRNTHFELIWSTAVGLITAT